MLSDSNRHSVLALLGWLWTLKWIILLIPAPYCLDLTKLTENKFIIHNSHKARQGLVCLC